MRLIPYILIALALFYLSALAYILFVAMQLGVIESEVILYMFTGAIFGLTAERQYKRMRRKKHEN